jgi:hypothetical protein
MLVPTVLRLIEEIISIVAETPTYGVRSVDALGEPNSVSGPPKCGSRNGTG